MLTISGGKTASSAANAVESASPPSTAWRTPVSTRRSSGFSACSARMPSERSSGRPESIIVASWREKTASSLSLTRRATGSRISVLRPVPARVICSGW